MATAGVLDRGVQRAAYADAVRQSGGLVGFWRLDERAGTNAHDQMLLHEGVYTGTPTLGVRGDGADGSPGITVNGSSQYVAIAQDVAYTVATTGKMSWAAWVRPTSSAALQFFFAKGGAGAGSIWEWGMARGLTPFNAGTGLGMFFWDGSGNTHVSVDTGSGSVPDNSNQWFYVVATVIDGSSTGALRIYLNGQLRSTGLPDSKVAGNGLSPVNIGRRPANDRYYTGDVRDCAIWNRALSPTEISDFYALAR